jgi:hypothetical protein
LLSRNHTQNQQSKIIPIMTSAVTAQSGVTPHDNVSYLLLLYFVHVVCMGVAVIFYMFCIPHH